MAANFLPTLSPFDIQRAAQLIQQAYEPTTAQASSDDQRRLQQELFDIQKRQEAWGLVIPFLESQDPNVQFFGAHTAQVKIARDWDSFPEIHKLQLRDLILDLTGHSVMNGRNKVILRKLFVALTSLALKLVPGHPSQWPNWILACVTALYGRGAATEYVLDFLSIAAEEVSTADFIGSSKQQMQQSLLDAVPMVVQAITVSITHPKQSVSPNELRSALKCLEAWIVTLPGNDLTPLIPLLISLLTPVSPSLRLEFDDAAFIAASDALQEIMSKSVLSNGSGSKTLVDPLLVWLDRWGGTIVEGSLTSGSVDETSRSLCKLLVALGDHSTSYLAANIASPAPITASITSNSSASTATQTCTPTPSPNHLTKGHFVQTFLKLLLAYTALPGFYGADEDESEMTLGFWYLFQEALWNADYYFQDGSGDDQVGGGYKDQWVVAKALYSELVQVLRRKVVWPTNNILSGWAKDQREKFRIYRRDVGDNLINAYYVLRNDMLGFYINDIVERLSTKREHDGWEEIEATLHCVMSIQEAIGLENNSNLERLFSADILGRLPTTGQDRVRRTALGIIGAYASWFTIQPISQPSATPSLLMNVISYVITALPEPALCLEAANALRDLCDANRTELAPHIGAFAELHAGLTGIPDTEKSKVLQSIASVIQALPPEEGIPPIEAIVTPVVAKLVEALHSSAHLPEEARAMAVLQLRTLSGITKGLTQSTESLLMLGDSTEEQAKRDKMRHAREDLRMAKLHEGMFAAVRNVVDLWSTDADVSDALSDLLKSITSLPSDTTLLSLPAGPLLELVCLASQRQLTSLWLSLASMLIIQLDPPSIIPPTIKVGPSEEAHVVISNILPVLLQLSLNFLGQSGAMESNPDVVYAFFHCMELVALHFVGAFYRLPPGALDALLQCAVSSLALQERYSVVTTCTFLGTFISSTYLSDELGDDETVLIQGHGWSIMRALLWGFAGVTPRSATPNLIDLLSTLISWFPAQWKAWMTDILFADDFVPSKAGPEAKEKFLKAASSSRSMKRIRDAAHQFTLIARGLEGSSFGYSTVVM